MFFIWFLLGYWVCLCIILPLNCLLTKIFHCAKSVRLWSFSGPYFPALGLNTEIYSVKLRIQFECGKVRTRKTPNTHSDNFYTVFTIEETRIIFVLSPRQGYGKYFIIFICFDSISKRSNKFFRFFFIRIFLYSKKDSWTR